MRPQTAVPVIAALFAITLTPAHAQAPSLQEQLNAQYKKVTMASNGTVVSDPGTLLSVQKGGILSVPYRALAKCPAKFENSSLHPSAGFCAGMMKNVSQYFRTGDKVYPLKVDVNFNKAKINFEVVACDSCNGVNPPTGMKGEVEFEFAKGYLETANAAQVEDIIGQVFTISDDQSAQPSGDQGQQPADQGGNQQPPADQGGNQPPAQQPEPQTVQLGMTLDQVVAILGKPDKIFDLGAKKIYVYKDVKVTFMNGKVSDVQ